MCGKELSNQGWTLPLLSGKYHSQVLFLCNDLLQFKKLLLAMLEERSIRRAEVIVIEAQYSPMFWTSTVAVSEPGAVSAFMCHLGFPGSKFGKLFAYNHLF